MDSTKMFTGEKEKNNVLACLKLNIVSRFLITVEEEHGIQAYNGQMFSLPHFIFPI